MKRYVFFFHEFFYRYTELFFNSFIQSIKFYRTFENFIELKDIWNCWLEVVGGNLNSKKYTNDRLFTREDGQEYF